MRHKPSTRTICLTEQKDGSKCRNPKQPNMLSCRDHWKLIPRDLQDEVYAGYHDEIWGVKHRAAIKKCNKIWSEHVI